MAVNLDKEAYYRRIKRLYSNWKVKLGDVGACVLGVQVFTVVYFKGEKVRCLKEQTAKLAAFFFCPAS